MKLKRKEKKEYKLDTVGGIFCSVVYTVGLLYVRFINHIENMFSNKTSFSIVSMFVVIVIIFLNCIMCINGLPNNELYNIINDFNVTTNNKKEIKLQRDTLLQIISEPNYSKKIISTIICFEVIVCIIVFILFIQDATCANLVTGLIIDVETALMAFMFFIDTHCKFKVQKNLK